MATASGDASGARRPVMPYVAYAVVLVLLGGTGVAFWAGQEGRFPVLPKSDRPSPPVAVAAPVAAATLPAVAKPAEPAPPAQGLKLPQRPPVPPVTAPKPAQAAVPSPSPVPISPAAPPSTTPAPSATPASSTAPASPTAPPSSTTPSSPPVAAPAPPASSEASAGSPAAAPAEKPAPAKSKCTVDGNWPTERTDQGKAIQGMLRDLGLYDGTVYGTVGPTTRAAIRKFQVSAGEPETGEPDQPLFDSLKKKCAASAP